MQELHEQVEQAFKGSFMQPEILHAPFVEIEMIDGETCAIPLDCFNWFDMSETLKELEIKRNAYGARTHAPGYLDSTEWTVFDTEEEALEYLLRYLAPNAD